MRYAFSTVLVLLFSMLAKGQGAPEFPLQKQHYIKGNALFLPALILNFGLESQITPKITWQNDFTLSPWKSINGNHAMLLMVHTEGRYYFKEAFKKWYVGINTGIGTFDITKWNHANMHRYQRGFSLMLGATVGYQYEINQKWNVELFAGGGTVQSFYHGYQESYDPPSLIRYDDAAPDKYNKSGEFLPYRGGIMISYRIK